MNNQPLTTWFDFARDVILRLPGRASQRYQSGPAADHFRRVAEQLWESTGVRPLAEAAYLHGVPVASIPDLKAEHVFDNELVEIVLMDRERLRATDHAPFAGAPVAYDKDQLLRSSFGRLRSSASVLLLIFEQLDHLDPTGTGRAWLDRFYDDPISTGPSPVLPKIQEARDTPDVHLAFVESLVAFTAGYFGFMKERRFARDLVALHRERQNVERVRAFIAEKHDAHVAFVQHTVSERMLERSDWQPDVQSIRWDWRHIRSCMLALDMEKKEETWPHRLGQCGFATVVTPNERAAYVALGALHDRGHAHHAAFRDYISRPSPSDYRALHTAIDVPAEGGGMRRLNVRILPMRSEPEADSRIERLRKVARNAHGLQQAFGTDDSIVVFTPSHEPKYVPAGSVVLNFAYMINSRWVARVESACINGKRVEGGLTPLQNGDTVDLKLSPKPEFLPKAWLDVIPKSKQRGLKEHYTAAVTPLIISAGRDAVREMFAATGLGFVPDHMLDSFVTAAAARGRTLGWFTQNYSAHEWFRQLGLLRLFREQNDKDVPGKLAIDEHRALQLKNLLPAIASTRSELDLPRHLRDQITNVVMCVGCRPEMKEPLLGVVVDKMLFVHRPACAAADGGEPLTVHHRIAVHQYVALDTSNRAGLLAEIANVLRKRHIDVIEMIGRRWSPQSAAVRLLLDCPSGHVVADLVRDLASIPGVHKVFGPDDPPSPLIEREMPPRRDGTFVVFGTNPIVKGTPVTNDEQFYGRQDELIKFHARMAQLVRPGAPLGDLLFVTGPLQTGKTSFVLKCLRDLQTSKTHPYVTVYLEAGEDESWNAYEIRLLRELERRVTLMAYEWGKPAPSLTGLDFVAAIRVVRDWAEPGAVVVAIDEVVRLMDATTSRGDVECDRLNQAITAAKGTARVCLMLIGPRARVRKWHDALASHFDRGEQSGITLPPFTDRDIRQLLAAAKLAWATHVRLDKTVALKVAELTERDPLWVGTLAYEMWERARQDETFPIARFTDVERVDYAVETLLVDAASFELRKRLLGGAAGTKYREPAEALLNSLARRTRTPAPSTAADLVVETGLAPHDVRMTLELLAHAGLVRSEPVAGRDGVLSFRIAAPILARYILMEHGLSSLSGER